LVGSQAADAGATISVAASRAAALVICPTLLFPISLFPLGKNTLAHAPILRGPPRKFKMRRCRSPMTFG
jgi:hypothetical protein